VPSSPLDEVGLLAQAYLIIAMVVFPLAVAIRARSSPRRQRFRMTTIPELEALIIIGVAFMLPPLVFATLEATGAFATLGLASEKLRAAFASLIALSFWLAFVIVLLRKIDRDPLMSLKTKNWPRDISAGIFAFLAITPVAFAVYLAVATLVVAAGGNIDRHPLQEFELHTPFGVALFLVTACVVAPIVEETIFRGLLLPWARGRKFRPWLIYALAVAMLLSGKPENRLATLLFLADLTLLMIFCVWGREIWRRWPNRTASAILSTAALFGAMHAGVWPTPVPLTVMGIGLGYVAFRSGNLRPAVVAHALFNGVSALALLRG
jgi:membrane protease YdiL (CAAX protease family)